MPAEPKPKPSFSRFKRWGIALNVSVIILLVLSVVVMANYLSRDYFSRFYWSSHTRAQLSPLTTNFLKSMTNRVKITLYYDRNDPFFSTVSSLLNEYCFVNRGISLETIDYLRDAGAAEKAKAQYKLTYPSATNLVIFECQDRVKVVDGNALAQYTLEAVPNAKEREFRKKPISFQGERMFTGALLAVSNPRPLVAYFLTGHGEHGPEGNDEVTGYEKFADLIRANYIRPLPLSLL
ncbi:MAG TPA: Gldg family protein, partial [Verrucomicrobiae bacterium]|nr:Gldg family protein [Verrucomicrobiae bacterium]